MIRTFSASGVASASGVTVLYPVAAGHHARFRSFYGFVGTGGSLLELIHSNGARLYRGTPGSLAVVEWQGWAVAEGGESIVLNLGAAQSVYWLLSGTLYSD